MKNSNLRQEFKVRAADLLEAFASTGEDGDSLKGWVEQAARELEEKQVVLDQMFKQFDEHGVGSIYKDSHHRYGFVLADASEEGSFRYQLFDARGFFSHSTFSTAEEALLELCDNGYNEVAPSDTLDKMSQTREWKFGTECLALRTAVSSGRKSWAEGEREYARLQSKYDPDLWVA